MKYVKYSMLVLVAFTLHLHAKENVMEKKKTIFVILAGGKGERLWPLSDEVTPKQFLPLGSESTLLEQAINRLLVLTYEENIWISTTKAHEKKVREIVGDRVGAVSIEPGPQDTGPAILLNCFEIYEKDPTAVIVFLPADPFIPSKDNTKFAQMLEQAIIFAHENDKITLLGAEPTYPATGYGYIEYEKNGHAPYPVREFREKPSFEVAQQYIENGNMLWNISIFCAKTSVFLQEFKTHAPEMYDSVQRYRSGEITYDSIRPKSIDYAVMEHSKHVYVLPVDFSWCDVGNIEVFLQLKQQYNTLDSNFIAIDSANNLIDVPKKLVALVGVEDLCVVETPHVLLITKRGKTERVRSIVKQLKGGRFSDRV